SLGAGEGRQFPDRDLPDRRRLPALAVGGETALAGEPTARTEGIGTRSGARVTVCLQRHVEAVSEGDRDPSRTSDARVRPLGSGFSRRPQARALRAADLIHRLVQVRGDVEAVSSQLPQQRCEIVVDSKWMRKSSWLKIAPPQQNLWADSGS